jgi:hypothetical protein
MGRQPSWGQRTNTATTRKSRTCSLFHLERLFANFTMNLLSRIPTIRAAAVVILFLLVCQASCYWFASPPALLRRRRLVPLATTAPQHHHIPSRRRHLAQDAYLVEVHLTLYYVTEEIALAMESKDPSNPVVAHFCQNFNRQVRVCFAKGERFTQAFSSRRAVYVKTDFNIIYVRCVPFIFFTRPLDHKLLKLPLKAEMSTRLAYSILRMMQPKITTAKWSSRTALSSTTLTRLITFQMVNSSWKYSLIRLSLSSPTEQFPPTKSTTLLHKALTVVQAVAFGLPPC